MVRRALRLRDREHAKALKGRLLGKVTPEEFARRVRELDAQVAAAKTIARRGAKR
jgi:hypothetical protein